MGFVGKFSKQPEGCRVLVSPTLGLVSRRSGAQFPKTCKADHKRITAAFKRFTKHDNCSQVCTKWSPRIASLRLLSHLSNCYYCCNSGLLQSCGRKIRVTVYTTLIGFGLAVPARKVLRNLISSRYSVNIRRPSGDRISRFSHIILYPLAATSALGRAWLWWTQ